MAYASHHIYARNSRYLAFPAFHQLAIHPPRHFDAHRLYTSAQMGVLPSQLTAVVQFLPLQQGVARAEWRRLTSKNLVSPAQIHLVWLNVDRTWQDVNDSKP
jgi:hypothetical protein